MPSDSDDEMGPSTLQITCVALLGLFAGYGAVTFGYQVRGILI